MFVMKTTRKFLISFLVLSFLSLAVFGFLGLLFGTGFSQCAASVVPGTLSCPMGSGSQQVEIFHSFSGVILTAMFVLFGILFSLILSKIPTAISPLSLVLKRQPEILNNERSFLRRNLDWLSLRLRSDLLA